LSQKTDIGKKGKARLAMRRKRELKKQQQNKEKRG